LAALGELLAEVVHEVRNGLVSIKTFVQLLPEHQNDPTFEARFREIAAAEFDRIERLLTSVLAQAAGESGPGEQAHCEIGAVVESVAALLRLRADRSQVTLTVALGDRTHVAMGADALRQVLMNLLLNALRVTDAAQEVRIETRTLGSAAEIRVEDRGPGVSREARRRIFEPFFSTRSDRAGGLGLAISLRLVEAVGGTLTVSDREGGGSCFRVRLPVI